MTQPQGFDAICFLSIASLVNLMLLSVLLVLYPALCSQIANLSLPPSLPHSHTHTHTHTHTQCSCKNLEYNGGYHKISHFLKRIHYIWLSISEITSNLYRNYVYRTNAYRNL